jgi:hypothetical protein
MNAKLYHRAFAVFAGLTIWGYAVFCMSLGRVYIPRRYATAGPTMMWSQERVWQSFDGAGGWAIILALVLAGAGAILVLPPAQSQREWERTSRRRALARSLLIAGAAAAVLGVVVSLFGGRPSPAGDLEAIRRWVEAQRAVSQRFESAKTIWGAMGAAVLIGLAVDLVLRRRGAVRS